MIHWGLCKEHSPPLGWGTLPCLPRGISEVLQTSDLCRSSILFIFVCWQELGLQLNIFLVPRFLDQEELQLYLLQRLMYCSEILTMLQHGENLN